MYSKGADFSKWDGGVNQDKVLDWPVYDWDFAFIKASEGLAIDPLFSRQWSGARGYTARGAYHFFRPNADPERSARLTVQYLAGDYGELPLALDMEALDNVSPAAVAARAFSWLSWYEQLTGIRPIVYSSSYFLGLLKSANYPKFAEYKLWLAQYPYDKMEPDAVRDGVIEKVLHGEANPNFPNPPAPFKKTTFWQWTAIGKPEDVPGYYTGPGSKKEVDFDFYNGTAEEMQAEFEYTLPGHVPEPPSTGVTMIGKVIVNALNIRPQPNTTQPAIGQLKLNDIVEADTETDGWWHLTKITRNGAVLVMPGKECYAYEGDTGGYIQDMTPHPALPTLNVNLSADGYPDLSVEW